MRKAGRVATLGFALAIWLGGAASYADAAYDSGVKLYGAKNYRAAAQQFEGAMKTAPTNPNVIYYCALSHYMSNNGARARQLFQYLSDNFGTTQQAQLARSVLAKMPGTMVPAGGGTSSPAGAAAAVRGGEDDDDDDKDDGTQRWLKRYSTGADVQGLPNEARIPFRKDRNGIFVEVQINNQSMEMCVDTGAPSTVVGENHMSQLGLTRPAANGKTVGLSGVGDRKTDMRWTQNCDFKCGTIYRKSFPITVMDHLPTDGLLGQTFFAPYNVTIDTQNSQLILKKKGVAAAAAKPAARSPWSVPFRWAGGHMIVDAQVNGKNCEMIFDTGASGVACFGMGQLKKLNIDIPSNYRKERHSGTGGETMGYGFPIDSIKLGPIVADGPWVSAVEGSNMDRALLGQEFFGDYNYSIDSEHKLIHFKKQQ